MKAHTTYKIFPKAINDFINDNYDLSNINFGNIKNNIDAILEKLKINTELECEWDITPLYFFDKVGINKNNNKPSDFEEFSNFKFKFKAIEGVTYNNYEKAIKLFEDNFINKYQLPIQQEREIYLKNLEKKRNKREQLVYFISGAILISLIIIVFLLKQN